MSIKNNVFALLVLVASSVSGQQFSDHFISQTCRVDLQFGGNHTTTKVYLDKVKKEPYWGGRVNRLTQAFIAGDFRFCVSDSATGQMLYNDGFNTLFREWQTTDEAQLTDKSFENSILFPYPVSTVVLSIDRRLGYDRWERIFTHTINPADPLIHSVRPPAVKVKVIKEGRDPSRAVDVAIVAEGYTARELKKFYREAERLAAYLLSHEPFKKHADRMNFYAVGAVSEESGVSMPNVNSWLNTAMGAHYHTFYSPRYLTSPQHYRIRDLASAVPYDAIYILANTNEYGGGGIYNFYALTAARGRNAREVTVHEFGHSFAGLADEYFYEHGDVLDAIYDVTVEPWEPNITSLQQFDLKWKKMLPAGKAIPTPLPEDQTGRKSTSAIGVYEGAGYKTKGMYRPTPDCRMKTNTAGDFCPVCIGAVEERILLLSE